MPWIAGGCGRCKGMRRQQQRLLAIRPSRWCRAQGRAGSPRASRRGAGRGLPRADTEHFPRLSSAGWRVITGPILPEHEGAGPPQQPPSRERVHLPPRSRLQTNISRPPSCGATCRRGVSSAAAPAGVTEEKRTRTRNARTATKEGRNGREHAHKVAMNRIQGEAMMMKGGDHDE